MITVEWNDAEIKKALHGLQNAVGDMQPALKVIGLKLVESTKARFGTSTAPDGTPWAPNRPATIAKYTHRVGRTKTKDGKLLSAKGEARWDSKKPLVDTGTLESQISSEADSSGVLIFSTMEYAAMQQFGGSKAEFPNLWGDIPARPFLGVSVADEAMILEIIENQLKNAI